MTRIPGLDAATIWDLGCGAGAITRMLADLWPGAAVTGLDSSPEMLGRAGAIPGIRWVEGGIADWSPDQPADIVFANASLHWLDDHDTLFPALAATLAPGGVLAVQMPRNFGEPSHQVLYEVARLEPWADRVGHRAGWQPVDDPSTYYDRLAPVCSRVEVWETIYFQLLHGEDAAAEWVKGSAARPFLEDLGDDAGEFFNEYTRRLRPHYPRRPDGSTLFPFRRLFIIATR